LRSGRELGDLLPHLESDGVGLDFAEHGSTAKAKAAHSPSAAAINFSSSVLIKWLNVSGGRIRALYFFAISGIFFFISAFFSGETGGGGAVRVTTRGPISINSRSRPAAATTQKSRAGTVLRLWNTCGAQPGMFTAEPVAAKVH
jgi:hypothetical protein